MTSKKGSKDGDEGNGIVRKTPMPVQTMRNQCGNGWSNHNAQVEHSAIQRDRVGKVFLVTIFTYKGLAGWCIERVGSSHSNAIMTTCQA